MRTDFERALLRERHRPHGARVKGSKIGSCYGHSALAPCIACGVVTTPMWCATAIPSLHEGRPQEITATVSDEGQPLLWCTACCKGRRELEAFAR